MSESDRTVAAEKTSDVVLVKRLLAQARPFWLQMAVILLVGLAATPLALLTPLPLKIAVDSVIGSDPLPGFLDAVLPQWAVATELRLLALAAVLQVLIVLLMQVQSLAEYALRTHVGEAMTLGFRARLFHHVERLSLSFHDRRESSDSIYRIQYDAPSLQFLTIWGLIPIVSALVMVAGMLYVTARIDWQLALVALAIAPVLAILPREYKRRMRGRYRDSKNLETGALKVVQEVLSSVRVVKAFGQEDAEHARYLRQSHASMRARVQLSLAEGLLGLAVNVTTAVGTAVVLYLGIRNVLGGRLTLGELLMVLAYLAQLYGPMKTVSQKLAGLQGSLVSAERAFALMDEAPELAERPDARPLSRARGEIEFRGVHFAYDGAGPVLRDVSFRVEPGRRVGIAGRTGAGKTTLVSLLTRFYDPNEGRILLDGIDLGEYRLADLRSQFAIVLQEPLLFSTSIAENIGYGRRGAGPEAIAEAARAANADAFIAALPEGYDTEVGERGVRLSGGERQRISLARAFLKDAPILVLDEPTSAVDLETERGILEAMERLMHGRTTFLIAHRPSTLAQCDVVLVIEDGRLASVREEVSDALAERLVGRPSRP